MTEKKLDRFGSEIRYRKHNGNKVEGLVFPGGQHSFEEIEEAIESYVWKEEDFLLTTFPKHGTHLAWEIMMMLLKGSAEYMEDNKHISMVEMFPVTNNRLPSPRVLSTHYRLDCLPDEFRGKKTVWVIRNPKDAMVSLYYHMKEMAKEFTSIGAVDSELSAKTSESTFSEFMRSRLYDNIDAYGTFFDYMDCMWSLKVDPNMLVLYYEHLKRNPVKEITKLNEFMKTDRSPELIAEIADRTSFSKMKKGKEKSEDIIRQQMFKNGQPTPAPFSVYRKGDIGDWKNHFTVAENEAFDKKMEEWQKGKNIPFIYE